LTFEALVSDVNYLGGGGTVDEPFGLECVTPVITAGQGRLQLFFRGDVIDDNFFIL
jgi:hypothetical protein